MKREAMVITGPTRADWKQVEIDGIEDFHVLQQLVGGYIELVNLGRGLQAYVNEDGRATCPPTVRWTEGLRLGVVPGTEVLHGPIVIVGRAYKHARAALVDHVLQPLQEAPEPAA